MNNDKFVIYLAGSIKNTTPVERHTWRNDIISKYKNEFDFLDPTLREADYKNAKTEEEKSKITVTGDRDDIQNSDIVIAYLDRSSIGTSMGIVNAFLRDRIVVVINKWGTK